MADINLTQLEADTLIAMEKQRVNDARLDFPGPGQMLAIDLTSTDKRENFILDVTRSRLKLTKCTYQNRARQAIILLRLDLDGRPHRNSDDQEIPCPHLHIYREGFGDKWAMPAPPHEFPNTANLFGTFEAFMKRCNITLPPYVEPGLF